MKILSISTIAIMILSLFAMPFMYAQDATTADSETPNLIATQDTEATAAEVQEIETEVEESMNEADASAGKVFGKQLGLLFTFKQEKIAEKELELARLRLIQAKIAAKNGDSEAMLKALEAHERLILKAQARVDKLDGATKEGQVKDSAEKLVGLERAVEVHEARIAKLKTLLESFDLTEEERAKIEEKIAKTEEVTSKLKELQQAKEEKIKTKLMAVGEMTEEEANAAIDKIKEEKGLIKAQKANLKLKTAEAEKLLEKAKERIANAKGK